MLNDSGNQAGEEKRETGGEQAAAPAQEQEAQPRRVEQKDHADNEKIAVTQSDAIPDIQDASAEIGNLNAQQAGQEIHTSNSPEKQQHPKLTKELLEQYLNEVIEENPDYFEHKAGKCLCSLCKCGQCQYKCQQLNQKLGQSLKLSWVSSYQKDYSDHSSAVSLNSKLSKIHDEGSNIISAMGHISQLESTFQHDYQRYEPAPSTHQKRVYQRNTNPFSHLTSYNTQFLDYGG